MAHTCFVVDKSSTKQSTTIQNDKYGMVIFRLFENPRYSNEISTKFENVYLEQKYLEEESGKMDVFQISPKIGSLY